ncbi:MAG: hypothetical protein H7124_17505 [Phycisphaerales bacterium]|nr:hypothetical protein [Hyphomonadaceae bacterium]
MSPDFKGEFESKPLATISSFVVIVGAIWTLISSLGLLPMPFPVGKLPLAYGAAAAVGAVGGLISIALVRIRLWLGATVSLVLLLLTARVLRPIINQFEIVPGSTDFWLIAGLAYAVFVGVLAEAIWLRYRDEAFSIVLGLGVGGVATLAGFLNTFGMTGR